MKKSVLILSFFVLAALQAQAQKQWTDDGITITKLDTLGNGYEALRGTFTIENTSVYEVMNMILDVDGYDWVEGPSVSKMLLVDEVDSSFTFDFFVRIPWLFVKKTGRVKVDVRYKDGTFYTRSHQIREYDHKDDYDMVDFYSAQWKLKPVNSKDVKVTYLGVYQDQKMLININRIIINQIRRRLGDTFYNLRARTTQKIEPSSKLHWPVKTQQENTDRNR